MRILHATPGYPPLLGGIEILVPELIAEHRRAGHECAVIAGRGPGEHETVVEQRDGAAVLRVPVIAAIAAQDPALLLGLRRDATEFLRAFAPDVLHDHDPGPVGWLVRQALGGTRVPCVASVHNTHGTPTTADEVEPRRRMLRETVGAADAVVAVSTAVADDLRAFLPDMTRPVTVVHNGVRPLPSPLPPTSGSRLLSLGRLVPQKGHERLVDVLVDPRLARCEVDVVGVGPQADVLAERARAAGVADRFRLVGSVDPADVPSLLAASAALVMPSRFEGMPLAALEAAWAGRAVVGADVPGIASVVDHEVTGLLVDVDDTRAFAAALDRVTSDIEIAWQLGRNARAKAEVEFTVERCARAYLELYESVRS